MALSRDEMLGAAKYIIDHNAHTKVAECGGLIPYAKKTFGLSLTLVESEQILEFIKKKSKKDDLFHEKEENRVPYTDDVDEARIAAAHSLVSQVIKDSGCGDKELARDQAIWLVYQLLREFRPDLFEDHPKMGKYGTPEGLAAKLMPGEPWFTFLGRDIFTLGILSDYVRRLEDANCANQADDVRDEVIPRFAEWQNVNSDKVKVPD